MKSSSKRQKPRRDFDANAAAGWDWSQLMMSYLFSINVQFKYKLGFFHQNVVFRQSH